jgi:hypothetical protein
MVLTDTWLTGKNSTPLDTLLPAVKDVNHIAPHLV